MNKVNSLSKYIHSVPDKSDFKYLADMLKIADSLESRELPPDHLCDWLSSVLYQVMENNISFDELLELKSSKQGGKPTPMQYKYWIRNKYFKKALIYCEGTERNKTKMLSQYLNQFMSEWTKSDVATLSVPPQKWSELKKIIFKAFKIGLGFPVTVKALNKAIKASPPEVAPTDFTRLPWR